MALVIWNFALVSLSAIFYSAPPYSLAVGTTHEIFVDHLLKDDSNHVFVTDSKIFEKNQRQVRGSIDLCDHNSSNMKYVIHFSYQWLLQK